MVYKRNRLFSLNTIYIQPIRIAEFKSLTKLHQTEQKSHYLLISTNEQLAFKVNFIYK